MTGEDYILDNHKFRPHKYYQWETNKKACEDDFADQLSYAMSRGYFRKGEGGLMKFDGKRYIVYEDNELRSFVRRLLRKLEYSVVYQISSLKKICDSIVTDDRIPLFNPNRNFLVFENGMYDFERNEFIEKHSHKIDTCIYIPHIYYPKAKGGRFKAFLDRILPDRTVQSVLQEACGSMFIDRSLYKMEYAFYLLGSGSNGKSTFTDLLGYMLGSTNISYCSLTQICDSNKGEYYRARIAGKVLNICTDMGDRDFSGDDTYKALVSGENISCRHPSGRVFETRQVPLIMANVNKMPISNDQSHGYHRRNIVIPFNETISDKEQDKTLSHTLQEEISVFINWVLDGRTNIEKNKGKLTESEIVDNAKYIAKIESSSLYKFLYDKDIYTKVPDNKYVYVEKEYALSDLYYEYTEYCREWGFVGKGKNKVSIELKGDGAEKIHKNDGTYFILYNKGSKKDDSEIEVKPPIDDLFFDEQQALDNLPF